MATIEELREELTTNECHIINSKKKHSGFNIKCAGCNHWACTNHIKMMGGDIPICSFCYTEEFD